MCRRSTLGRGATFVVLVLTCLTGSAKASASSPMMKVDLRMPGVRPSKPDAYICRYMRLPPQDAYIVRFVPHTEQNTVHHLLVFTCTLPGSTKSVWGPCTQTCRSGRRVVFGWGKNAPSMNLPKGVGMPVGPSTTARFLVLQLHYTDPAIVPPSGDYTGVSVYLSYIRPHYLAGIYLLVSNNGNIPAGKSAYNRDIACAYRGPVPLRPMAFRVHAHRHGTQITGYRVRDGIWTVIGTQDPQQPQAFYPVADKTLTIEPGDVLAARCTYNTSGEAKDLSIWMTRTAEMCNFYMMYYASARNIDLVPRVCSGSIHGLNFAQAPMPTLPPSTGNHLHHHHMQSPGGMSHEATMHQPVPVSSKPSFTVAGTAGSAEATQRPSPTVVTHGNPSTGPTATPAPTGSKRPGATSRTATATVQATSVRTATTPKAMHPSSAAAPKTSGHSTTGAIKPSSKAPLAATQPVTKPPPPPQVPSEKAAAAAAAAVGAGGADGDKSVHVVDEPTEIPVLFMESTTTTPTNVTDPKAHRKLLNNRIVVITLIVVAMSFGALLSGAVVRHYQMMKRRHIWWERFSGSGHRRLMVDPKQKLDGSLPANGNNSRTVKFHQLPVDQSSDSGSEDF